MANLQEVYNRIEEKKKEYRTIAKSFQDDLKSSPRYQEIIDQMKRLREEKKSLEDQAKAAAMLDATKMETLKLDIATDKEMLSDIALTMYIEEETVQVVDKDNSTWTPLFSVKFVKAKEGEEQLQQQIAAVDAETEAVAEAHAEEEQEARELAPAM